MKRCIFGAGLLIGLLVLSLTVQCRAAAAPAEISGRMSLAAQAAAAGDAEKAEALAGEARAMWNHTRSLQCWLHHREPIQKIDVLFSQLEVWKARNHSAAYRAVCLSLRQRTAVLAGD